MRDTSDEILKKIFKCEVSGKPYKIIKQELEQYRNLGVAVPHRCPDQRYKDKMELREPYQLFDRKCAKCQTAIETSFSVDKPEIVYCQSCYERTL